MKSFTLMAGLCALLMAGCVSQPSATVDAEDNCEPTDAQCGGIAPANSAAEIFFKQSDADVPPVDFSYHVGSRKEYADDEHEASGSSREGASGSKQQHSEE